MGALLKRAHAQVDLALCESFVGDPSSKSMMEVGSEEYGKKFDLQMVCKQGKEVNTVHGIEDNCSLLCKEGKEVHFPWQILDRIGFSKKLMN